jgi:hypothetical protein
VDGPEAHAALVARLGQEPVAPKALSGSRKPSRYHLFFRCPDLPTKAKVTPWHPSLEFRGKGGVVIIPPSLHRSGNRYEWAPGQSPADLPLPALPDAVVSALREQSTPGRPPAATVELPDGLQTSPSTRRFLSGLYANGPKWNDRLFRAACDLQARGLPQAVAEPLLVKGAQPWDSGEEEKARETVRSAFNQARTPAHS